MAWMSAVTWNIWLTLVYKYLNELEGYMGRGKQSCGKGLNLGNKNVMSSRNLVPEHTTMLQKN